MMMSPTPTVAPAISAALGIIRRSGLLVIGGLMGGGGVAACFGFGFGFGSR
ncbi:hypothetical protein DB30_02120 [Enhygromyxa salina]|uniref:Uncharacterized protein n=1 Tax=Enhygromyxa salina TaxID=215803 RepID=A0A0C2CVV1_9BACT|nr:hypothetical protein DB30_02120 [Enhygromyxa salina]